MKREIKLRAFDPVKKEMHLPEYSDDETFYVSAEGEVKWIEETTMGGYEAWRHLSFRAGWILMQFTGLKDKNGKEIYEGDIVESQDFRKGVKIIGKQPLRREVVTWLSDMGRWEFGNNKLFSHRPEHHEIIGNIYENVELINAAKSPANHA